MRILLVSVLLLLCIIFPSGVTAQQPISQQTIEVNTPATSSADTASSSADIGKRLTDLTTEDVTKPEEKSEREKVLDLLKNRSISPVTPLNIMAYTVQSAIRTGLPANTVLLILLLPLIATIIAFIRLIIGLPSLEMLVPILLSVSLVATGLPTGSILLISILFGSLLSRFILKKVRVMQLPKMALSLFIVSLIVFFSLFISASYGILAVQSISIFPILVFILLSDKIVMLQLQKNLKETFYITGITIGIALIGYALLLYEPLRNMILLYPELILLLIPVNILIGRYFGLRLTEYFRFSELRK